MMAPPQAAMLPGDRLHLQHGPIDLIIEAMGPPGAREAAFAAAWGRFAPLLRELCAELPGLRRPSPAGGRGQGEGGGYPVENGGLWGRRSPHPNPLPQAGEGVLEPMQLQGEVARRMARAVWPHAAGFITPMAAVAGAVADEILAAMREAAPLRRASVNNGGDIALYLAAGESLRIGLVDRPDRPSLFAAATVRSGDGVGGVATSGWRGRSFSFGIADAVTVLAADAATADAAATVIANAVDLPGHPGIERLPAWDLQIESDLGPRLVTRNVPELAPAEIVAALAAGLAEAERLRRAGLIAGAALHCAGITRVVANPSMLQEETIHA